MAYTRITPKQQDLLISLGYKVTSCRIDLKNLDKELLTKALLVEREQLKGGDKRVATSLLNLLVGKRKTSKKELEVRSRVEIFINNREDLRTMLSILENSGLSKESLNKIIILPKTL